MIFFEGSVLDTMTDDEYHMDFPTLRTSYYDWIISHENDIIRDKLEELEEIN